MPFKFVFFPGILHPLAIFLINDLSFWIPLHVFFYMSECLETTQRALKFTKSANILI